MAKKTTSPVATISPEILAKHPLMLTRALDESKAPIASGKYTLDELRSTFGVEGDQSSVLLELSSRGHAFFRQGETFYSFMPLPDDLNLPIAEETEETIDDENGDDELEPETEIEIVDPDELAEDMKETIDDENGDDELEPETETDLEEDLDDLVSF